MQTSNDSGNSGTVNVIVKWSNKKFPIEVNLGEPGIVFKNQVYSATNVSPDRQKIMVKGGLLKDDTDMSTLKLKENQQLMMMGTVGELLKEPKEKPKFMEDMTDAEMSKAMKIPAGLANHGNTCYLNATVQCLRVIPALPEAIKRSNLAVGSDPYSNLANSLQALVQELDTSGIAVQPFLFIQVLRNLYPQFAEQDRNGFMQQDAEECWGQLVQALGERVNGFTSEGDIDPKTKFVDQYMTLEYTCTTSCPSVPAETPSVSIESSSKLRVNIGVGVSTHLVTEIENSLVETLEKTSPTTGKMENYSKVSKISRLPQYLAINFVRFQWKPQEKIKAKILKRVQFPFDLDMTSFCSEELQQKMMPVKEYLKEYEQDRAEAKKSKKESNGVVAQETQKLDFDTSFADRQAKLMSLGTHESLVRDPGVNSSGQYELAAVLTHVGRGANSGHYIGWAKQNDSDSWWKFDDDKVSSVSEDDIKKLEGGGDWHTAYICLYRSKLGL